MHQPKPADTNTLLYFMETHRSPSWISPLARTGYAAKGLVYVIIGYLAAETAFGDGGMITGSSGALGQIRSQPFGQVLLVIVGLGLLAYALFRLLGAFVDVENEGEDGEGLAKRAGYFGSGVAYAGLGIAALTGLSGGGGGGSEEKWTAKVLAMPAGQWLVGALGVAIIIAGIFQWVKALKEKYKSKFTLESFAATKRRWIEGIAKVGLCARGVVFPIIGFFLIRAAMQSDPSEAKGLGEALTTLTKQPYGTWLLGLTAIGLVCYGIYCWVLTAYGNFGAASSKRA